MNINASIVDQRLSGILESAIHLLPPKLDKEKQRSVAFILLCISTMLEISLEDASELLTEGGQDEGVDGLHIGEVEDGEFTVTIFQGKYKHKDLSGNANFPENGVLKAIATIAGLFDPARKLVMNKRLAPRVEEIRSLIRDGYIPTVRIVLCNNGAKWTAGAQLRIDQSGFPDSQVIWSHFNHESIVGVLQRLKSVDDIFRLEGRAVIEEFNYRRVLIGKVSVSEIAQLFDRHDDLLLQRNIRRYLGLHANRINMAIHNTLIDQEKNADFYFYNNGITMICKKFRHNALQGENYQLKLEGMQIINGGQTCKTIQQTLNGRDLSDFKHVYVLLRLYELAENDQDFVLDITNATNSQNPVDLRDLRSNDTIQRQLEIGIADLGYSYKRQREEAYSSGSHVITASTIAESVLAIWRRMPQQAKFRRKEHFGKLYLTIFNDLQAAQAILAIHIFRITENERKRPSCANPPSFLPYASHYIAMLIGDALLQGKGVTMIDINHQSFLEIEDFLNQNQKSLYQNAILRIEEALNKLYGGRTISLQQLAATFRRGDLLEFLTFDQA